MSSFSESKQPEAPDESWVSDISSSTSLSAASASPFPPETFRAIGRSLSRKPASEMEQEDAEQAQEQEQEQEQEQPGLESKLRLEKLEPRVPPGVCEPVSKAGRTPKLSKKAYIPLALAFFFGLVAIVATVLARSNFRTPPAEVASAKTTLTFEPPPPPSVPFAPLSAASGTTQVPKRPAPVPQRSVPDADSEVDQQSVVMTDNCDDYEPIPLLKGCFVQVKAGPCAAKAIRTFDRRVKKLGASIMRFVENHSNEVAVAGAFMAVAATSLWSS